MSRRHARWGVARTAIWLGGAFAAGCLPSARLVTRAFAGADIEGLGDGKPGAANVGRNLGKKVGALVLAIDATKAYAPARAARFAGAPDVTVAALAVTPMVAHVTVVGGRGAAAALGTCFAMDTGAMPVTLTVLIAGSKLGRHPQAVLASAFTFAMVHWLLRRRPAALMGLLVPAIIVAARLRGSRGAPTPASPRVWWNRLLIDRDE